MFKSQFLGKCLLIFFLLSIGVSGTSSCAKHDANTIKVVKPKSQKKPYNPNKNKHSKRTKKVKMKN